MIAQGSVKVGRWSYPATQTGTGLTKRNTKRDGTGEWEQVDPKVAATFVADAPADFAPVETPAPLTGVVAPHDTYTPHPEDASEDFKLARRVLANTWNTMIWGEADEVRPADVTEKRAIEVLAALGKLGFVVRERADKNTGFKAGTAIYMATPNVDEATMPELLAKFDAEVAHDLTIKAQTPRADKPVNNTHKKPGRSTWAVGDKCPQGHKLEEGDVYVMPSGRKQCRKCRSGYASNL